MKKGDNSMTYLEVFLFIEAYKHCWLVS